MAAGVNWWPFISKMCRLEDKSLYPVMQSFLGRKRAPSNPFKRLIQRKAAESFIQLVWDSIQNTPGLLTLSHYSCFIPLAALKCLALDQIISVNSV